MNTINSIQNDVIDYTTISDEQYKIINQTTDYYNKIIIIKDIIFKLQYIFPNDLIIAHILTLFNNNIKRYFNRKNKFIKNINPEITFFENVYSLITTNNNIHSSKIDLYRFYKGILSNYKNSFGKYDIIIPQKDENFRKYLLYTSDFCLNKKNILRNNELINTNKKVKIIKNKVYIDGTLYDNNACKSLKLDYTFVNSIFKLQQNYQHLGIHLICTYGYNLLKSHDINNIIQNNDIINSIFEYGDGIRDVTEGFGKYATLNMDTNDNTTSLLHNEVNILTHMLENIHLKLHENLLNNHLHNKITRKVYYIYVDECKQYLNIKTIGIISKKINMTKKITFNIIINLFFLLTYYHNITHYNLIYLPSLLYNNANVIGLLNQTFYCIQNKINNKLLIKIQNSISDISITDSKLIGNAHF